jgi:hypothetical protein
VGGNKAGTEPANSRMFLLRRSVENQMGDFFVTEWRPIMAEFECRAGEHDRYRNPQTASRRIARILEKLARPAAQIFASAFLDFAKAPEHRLRVSGGDDIVLRRLKLGDAAEGSVCTRNASSGFLAELFPELGYEL